jgi:hypothetical protein
VHLDHSRVAVAEVLGDDEQRHAVHDCQGGPGVPQGVKRVGWPDARPRACGSDDGVALRVGPAAGVGRGLARLGPSGQRRVPTTGTRWPTSIMELEQDVANSGSRKTGLLGCISAIWAPLGDCQHTLYPPVYTEVQVSCSHGQ